MFKRFKENYLFVCAPCSGTIIDLEDVNDEAFANGYLGKGFAMIPDGHDFYAPISGKISVLFPVGHSFSIENKEGISVLVHIGLESYKCKNIFKKHGKLNQEVEFNKEKIITANIKELLDKKIDIETPVVIPEEVISKFKKFNIEKVYKTNKVSAGDKVLKISFK